MRKLKISMIAIAFVVLATGCTEQRDLFVKAPSMLMINTQWHKAYAQPAMWTAIFYNENKRALLLTEVKDSISIQSGGYEALAVNGTLSNGIDYVRFQGTDKFNTFEAYATLKSQDELIFAELDGQTINNPDTLYGTSIYKDIEGNDAHYRKYKDGRNGFHVPIAHLGDTVVFIPERLTYKVTVVATLHAFENAANNTYVVANQSGFASSVFVGSGLPSHQSSYQEFSFARNPYKGSSTPLQSYTSTATYNSFGPPIDLSVGERSYTVKLKLVLCDGSLYIKDFDVSVQVEAIINKIKQDHITAFTIYISDTLPLVENRGIDVGVAPWDKDVYIEIPAK